jgi:DNA-binding MarR family transcriptional regulator
MKSRADIERQLDSSIGFMLNVTSRRLKRLLQKRLSAHGLEYGAWFFLRILWVEEGFTQRGLCERTGLSQPTAATALRKMLHDGLIHLEPDPEDRRASHVFLTDKARAMKPEFAKLVRGMHRKVTADISEADLALVRDVMRKIRENCDRLDTVGV